MQLDHSHDAPSAGTKAPPPLQRSLVIISGNSPGGPHFGDLWQLASRAGLSVFESRWDSYDAPAVRAFEAHEVRVALVGPTPKIGDETLPALFARQGFLVVAVAAPGAGDVPDGEEAAGWVLGATSFPTGKAPLPESSIARLDEFNPTAILRALDVGP